MSLIRNTPSQGFLPNEIIFEITKHLSFKDLLRFRFVNRGFSNIAASFLFRSVTVGVNPKALAKFKALSKSEHFRVHVKKLTCDSTHPRTGWKASLDMFEFLMALPRIRHFRNVEEMVFRVPPLRITLDKDWNCTVRSATRWMFDIVFRCLTGSWTEDVQEIIGDRLLKEFRHRFDFNTSPYEVPKTPMPIKTIKLLDLEDEETDLTHKVVNLRSFQTAMNLESLVCMELHTVRDIRSLMMEGHEPRLMPALGHTWLTPKFANKLQVLSLSSEHPWGYQPKMDFRVIGIEGLENLKVLSLVNYQFSHTWQIEWFGALPIEELRLVGCAVLFLDHNYQQRIPETADTVVEDLKGNTHRFSNEGYYITGSRRGRPHFPPLENSLRWKHFFWHWAESMTNLKFFRMEEYSHNSTNLSNGSSRDVAVIDSAGESLPHRHVCEYFNHGLDAVELRRPSRDKKVDGGRPRYLTFRWEEEEDDIALRNLLSVVRERAGLGCLEEAAGLGCLEEAAGLGCLEEAAFDPEAW
ncbi:hypothetical protein ACHAQK_009670 [Fusarium lateritium]